MLLHNAHRSSICISGCDAVLNKRKYHIYSVNISVHWTFFNELDCGKGRERVKRTPWKISETTTINHYRTTLPFSIAASFVRIALRLKSHVDGLHFQTLKRMMSSSTPKYLQNQSTQNLPFSPWMLLTSALVSVYLYEKWPKIPNKRQTFAKFMRKRISFRWYRQ